MMMDSDLADFKIGNWWVRPQLNELENSDQRRHLEARSMEVLLCLARHAPTVVSKEQLIAEVWTDSPFVSDDVISHAIWELRKALGDSARSPSYIKTIPRKGYLIVAEVLRPQGSALPIEGAQIDHYDIHEEIGRGSMGVVFRATDRQLGRTVAIKFLATELTRDDKARQRFHREARLAASLDHPNLATVHQVGETAQGQIYLVTSFYSGGSLKDLLAKGPVPAQEALELARQLAAGLGAAHKRGIIHRDIKPANLLLDEHGHLKIADFGIAKLLGGTDLTRTGAALGTPAYKSPEQSRGQEVDQRTDLWSVGVVLFELLTGRRPFDGEYEQAVVHSILSHEPQALAEVGGQPIPAELSRIVGKAMAKEPEERYQSGEEMVSDLARASVPGVVTKDSPRARVPTVKSAIGVSLAATALIVLAWAQPWKTVGPLRMRATEVLANGPSTNNQAIAHFHTGQKFWLSGNDPKNLSDALRHLEHAAELAPDWADAYALLALFKSDRFAETKQQGLLEDIRQLAEQVKKLDPSNGLIKVAEARLHLLNGQFIKAEQLTTSAIEAQSTCPEGFNETCDLAHLWRAEAEWSQGQQADAVRRLESCLGIGNGRIRCRLKLAQLYNLSGNSTKAAVLYEEVLALIDKQTTALNDLGVYRLEARQYQKAVGILTRLEKLTHGPRATLNLGHAYYGLGYWESARNYYLEADERYKSLGQNNPIPAVSIGDTFLEEGQPDMALPWFEKAALRFEMILQGPVPAIIWQAQNAVCLAKLGKTREALQQINTLVRHEVQSEQPFAPIFYYAARVFALDGDQENLFRMARLSSKAGNDLNRLTDDAAFIDWRKHQGYQILLVDLSSGTQPPLLF